MSYPNQPWRPYASQPGPPPQFSGRQYSPAGGYPPGYGPPGPRVNLGALDRTKIAAGIVVVSGLLVLIGSLFSLYSVTVTPSALPVRNNDAPSGSIGVGIGFYDILPFAAPIVAQAVPLLMVLTALLVAPRLFGPPRKASPTPAVLAGTAALLSIVVAISGPLPSVDLNGQMAARLSEKSGGHSIDSMIDSVVSVSPGGGLVIAIIFSSIGWAAAVALAFQRSPRPAPESAAPYPAPPGHPTTPQYGPGVPPPNAAWPY